MRVLLVDHSAEARSTLEATLQERGHLVRAVDDYPAAITACGIQTFPLIIISDGCLSPDQTEELAALRRHRHDEPCTIVVLTNGEPGRTPSPVPDRATRVWPRSQTKAELEQHMAVVERATEEAARLSLPPIPVQEAAADFEARLSGTQARAVDAYQQINEAVAERHRAETTLAEAEARYAELVKDTGDTVLVVQHDEIVLANRAAADLLGAQDPKQLLGQSLRPFCHPDTMRKVLRDDARQPTEFESKMIRLDGRVRTVSMKKSAITLSGLAATQFILRDETSQRTAEKGRQLVEAQLAALLDQLSDTVFTVTEDGTITSYNRPPGSIDPLGRKLTDLFSRHDSERLKLSLERVFLDGASESFAVQARGTENPVWFDGRMGPIRGEERVTGALVVLTRGTDGREMPSPRPSDIAVAIGSTESAALIMANAELERLAAIASAAARDCGALLGNSATKIAELLKDMSKRSPYRGHLEAIDQAIARAASIADAVQRASATDPEAAERVTLAKLLRGMSDMLRTTLPDQMSLRIEVPRTMRETEVDPIQLRRAVLTLVLDAADASGPGGTITVSAGDSGDRDRALDNATVLLERPDEPLVYLEVTDTSPPIDEKTLAALGTQYDRIPSRRGLGLVAVLRVVQALQGAVVIAPGEGEGNVVRLLFAALPAGRANGRRARGSRGAQR